LDLRDSKWKNAIPFKLKKIHLFGFERFKMENYHFVQLKITHLGWRDSSGNCVWKNHPRLGLNANGLGEIQMQVLFKLKSTICKSAILFKPKITSLGLRDKMQFCSLINSPFIV
jgi:hypothetical protein